MVVQVTPTNYPKITIAKDEVRLKVPESFDPQKVEEFLKAAREFVEHHEYTDKTLRFRYFRERFYIVNKNK
jgi:predicted metal-dependent hydrolase